MDLSDTFPEAQKAATKIDLGAKDPEKEVIIEELKRVRAQLVETQRKLEELSKENKQTFTIPVESETAKGIKGIEKLTDTLITSLLGKKDIKLDDISLIHGAIAALEKYRTMKINIYSMTKFRYPTGEQSL